MFNWEERYSEVKCNGDREMTIGHCIWQHGDHCELTKSTSNAEARRGVSQREKRAKKVGTVCVNNTSEKFNYEVKQNIVFLPSIWSFYHVRMIN